MSEQEVTDDTLRIGPNRNSSYRQHCASNRLNKLFHLESVSENKALHAEYVPTSVTGYHHLARYYRVRSIDVCLETFVDNVFAP
jgi:hypothetical protein